MFSENFRGATSKACTKYLVKMVSLLNFILYFLFLIMIATGIDVESVLRSFHHHHYLPNAMKLVVVGPQSLDELKANVLLAADGEWPTATSPLPV